LFEIDPFKDEETARKEEWIREIKVNVLRIQAAEGQFDSRYRIGDILGSALGLAPTRSSGGLSSSYT